MTFFTCLHIVRECTLYAIVCTRAQLRIYNSYSTHKYLYVLEAVTIKRIHILRRHAHRYDSWSDVTQVQIVLSILRSLDICA